MPLAEASCHGVPVLFYRDSDRRLEFFCWAWIKETSIVASFAKGPARPELFGKLFQN